MKKFIKVCNIVLFILAIGTFFAVLPVAGERESCSSKGKFDDQIKIVVSDVDTSLTYPRLVLVVTNLSAYDIYSFTFELNVKHKAGYYDNYSKTKSWSNTIYAGQSKTIYVSCDGAYILEAPLKDLTININVISIN